MQVTNTMLGYVSLAAVVAFVAIVLARPRHRATNRFVGRSASATRPGWRTPTEWFDSDPVLFVGGDAGSGGAGSGDCAAGGDGGGRRRRMS